LPGKSGPVPLSTLVEQLSVAVAESERPLTEPHQEQCSSSAVQTPTTDRTIVTPEAIRSYSVSYRVQQQSGRKRVSRGAVISTISPCKMQVELAESAKKAKLEKKTTRAQSKILKKEKEKKVETELARSVKNAKLQKKSPRAEGKS